MIKGKNKHNSKIWELIENYFEGNINTAIEFFASANRDIMGAADTYEAEYFSEAKNKEQKLIICDSRPPYDKEKNFIHVAAGDKEAKEYSYEYKTKYEVAFIPADKPYLGEALNYNRKFIEYCIKKSPGQEEIQKEKLRHLNNAIGKYIETSEYFDKTIPEAEPGLFMKFFGVFFGNKKVNNIIKNINNLLLEYGLIDLETAGQVVELKKLSEKFNDFLPTDKEPLYLSASKEENPIIPTKVELKTEKENIEENKEINEISEEKAEETEANIEQTETAVENEEKIEDVKEQEEKIETAS